MIREKIISLARECGVWLDDDINMSHHAPNLERFATLIRKEAFEAAAKLCDERITYFNRGAAEAYEAENCAAAIREMAKENGK